MNDNTRDGEEKNNTKSTKAAIDWRRDFVLRKLSAGWSQSQVAAELHLHPSTISLDVQYLKERARNELKTHLTERLPWEHTKVMNGIQDLLRQAHEILHKTTDEKMKLQTISVLTGLYNTVMSLATDAGIIQQSLKRLEVMQDKNEAIFSDQEVKEYYQKEGESASDDCESIEKEIETETETEQEQDEDLKEE